MLFANIAIANILSCEVCAKATPAMSYTLAGTSDLRWKAHGSRTELVQWDMMPEEGMGMWKGPTLILYTEGQSSGLFSCDMGTWSSALALTN